ncbi:MAG: helix-turn-helix domain-containing protein [Roseococcus sp.]|nr:helix-turn-helix domain-containing protein [Roseococcus sp.]
MDLLDVCNRLEAACAKAGSQRAWARSQGISEAQVSDILNARRPPAEAVLAALGLARRVIYVEVGKSA